MALRLAFLLVALTALACSKSPEEATATPNFPNGFVVATSQKATMEFGPDGSAALNLNFPEIAIKTLTIKVDRTSGQLAVEVTILTVDSLEISAPLGETVFQYIQLDHSGLENKDIESATIRLEV